VNVFGLPTLEEISYQRIFSSFVNEGRLLADFGELILMKKRVVFSFRKILFEKIMPERLLLEIG
jgi:hypothetical protein